MTVKIQKLRAHLALLTVPATLFCSTRSATSQDLSPSVFQVRVSLKTSPNAFFEGTGFAVSVQGNPNNPTLYILTAAHVILGEDADDDTKVKDIISQVSVRFGGAVGDHWNINLDGIRIAPQWKSSGRDFALLPVPVAGRRIDPLPLSRETAQVRSEFTAWGFPPTGAQMSAVPIKGDVLQAAGSSGTPWILVDGAITPGMSGGPCWDGKGVFGIIHGPPPGLQQLKYLVPVDLARNFLIDNIPGLTLADEGPPPPPRQLAPLLARAWVVGKRTHFDSVIVNLEKRGDPVTVGCEQKADSSVSYSPDADSKVISHSAHWTDLDNIKSHSAQSDVVGTQILAAGFIVGLDRQVFNCPGGGHGTLVLALSIERRTAITEEAVIDIGSSEVLSSAVTFAVPNFENFALDNYRVDLSPLGGAAPPVKTIQVGKTSVVTQVAFGRTFKLYAENGVLSLYPVASSVTR